MNIVVDTNVFISALIKEGKTREIMFNTNYQLLFPEFEFEEIFNHKEEILTKSKLTEQEFNEIMLELLKKVRIIRTKRVSDFRQQARRIIGHIDKDEIIFIATALAFNCPIWSDDSHFQKQNKVKVLTTRELLDSEII